MDAHILIVDDDPLAGRVLGLILTDSGYQTTVLRDPRQVAGFLEENAVDLVLLAVILPDIDGFTLCEALRNERPNIAVVLISSRDSAADAVAGLERGADDYIAKPFETEVLLARIQAVLHRSRRDGRTRPDSAITVGDAALDLGTMRFSAPPRPAVALTPTEVKILECLMRNAHALITREALLARLSDGGLGGDSNRLDVYIRRLRKKIEADPDSPRFIHTVRGLGHVFGHGRHSA